MSGLAVIFADNLVPLFLVAGAGYLFGRRFKPDLKTVTRLAFYLLTPCLVFNSLTHNRLPAGQFWSIAGFAVATVTTLGLLGLVFGRLLRLDQRTLAGLLTVTMFGNGGNYGLPLVLFAFGETALSLAVVYYITNSVLVYTVGVIVASSGTMSPRQAIVGVFKVPALYALLLAGLINLLGWELPIAVSRPVTLLAEAAIPVMLVVLGLQLARIEKPERVGLVTGASVFQLVTGPVVGLALAALFGLTGPARQAAVIEAAMPTAVITTILAVEYNIDPTFVTGVVLVTMLLSPLTITPLIAYLGG